jgi:hypothetical protein
MRTRNGKISLAVAVFVVLMMIASFWMPSWTTAQVPSIYSSPQMYRVALGADQSLTAISGFTAPTNTGTIYVLVVTESDATGATWNIGAAATTSTPPVTSMWLPFNTAALSRLHLYGTGGHADVYLSP